MVVGLGMLDDDRQDDEGYIVSPMFGVIYEIFVEEGEFVQEEQVLLIIESLKMQNEIKASVEGIVNEILVEVSQRIDQGDRLLKING